MIVRTLTTFHTDLPDDAVETEDGMNFIKWPGRNVVEVIADLFRSIGWTPDEPIDLEERGWDLYVSARDGDVRLRISLIEEVIVQIINRSPGYTWFFRRKPPGPVFTGMLTALDKALKADGRFSDILWFTPEGYDNQTETGSPVPVEAGGDV